MGKCSKGFCVNGEKSCCNDCDLIFTCSNYAPGAICDEDVKECGCYIPEEDDD